MAVYRLSAQVIGRKDGRSAVAAAAYRAGEALRDERAGQVHDYRRKSDVTRSKVLAPPDAPTWMRDREQLWNAVEAAERRRDAQLVREVQLALPRELGPKAQWRLALKFVRRAFVGRGMVADVTYHRARTREGDEAQDHIHVMLTMRAITGQGFGKKAGHWNATDLLRAWRADWAVAANETLAAAGSDVRVDHRTLAAQRVEAEREAAASRAAGDEAGARAAEVRMVELDRAPEPKRGVRSDVVDAKGRDGERKAAWERVRASNQRRRAALMTQLEAQWELADAWTERAAELADERRQEAVAERDGARRELRLKRAALDGVGARFAAAGRELERRRAGRVRELDAALVAADDEAETASEERARSEAERRAAAIEEGWAAHRGGDHDDGNASRRAALGLVALAEQERAWRARAEAATGERATQEAAAWAARDEDARAARGREDAAVATATAAEVASWEDWLAGLRRSVARWVRERAVPLMRDARLRREAAERERMARERLRSEAFERARAARGAAAARLVGVGIGGARRAVSAPMRWAMRPVRERRARREAARAEAAAAVQGRFEAEMSKALAWVVGSNGDALLGGLARKLPDRERYVAALEAEGVEADAARASWARVNAALDEPLAVRLGERRPSVRADDTVRDVLVRGLGLDAEAARRLAADLPSEGAARTWVAEAAEATRRVEAEERQRQEGAAHEREGRERREEEVRQEQKARIDDGVMGLWLSFEAGASWKGDDTPLMRPRGWAVWRRRTSFLGDEEAREAWRRAHAQMDGRLADTLQLRLRRGEEVDLDEELAAALIRLGNVTPTWAAHLAEHLPRDGRVRAMLVEPEAPTLRDRGAKNRSAAGQDVDEEDAPRGPIPWEPFGPRM